MNRVTMMLAAIALSLGMQGALCEGQQEPMPQTVKGELLAINGEEYVIRDSFGRFVRLRVDKETKKIRVMLLGEKVEAQVWPNGRAIAIKPAQ